MIVGMVFISYVLNPQKLSRQAPAQPQTHQILQHLLEVVGLVIRVSQMTAAQQHKNLVVSNRRQPKAHCRKFTWVPINAGAQMRNQLESDLRSLSFPREKPSPLDLLKLSVMWSGCTYKTGC